MGFYLRCGIGKEEKRKRLMECRRLVDLLKTSRDPLVLAISAHDVGQYTKYGGDKAKQ